MGLRQTALSNLELARIRQFGPELASSGKVSSGPYSGQEYKLIAARRGFPSWYRVILKDESGVVERDIREKYL